MKSIRPTHLILLTTCTAVVLLAAVGCGPSLDPNKVPIQVLINYQGAPVNEAVVIFVSEDGKYANGLTGADGVAHMGTSVPGDGVFPGTYRAAVDKSQLIEESDPNDLTGTKILRREAVFHVPARYSDFQKSGLAVNVAQEGDTEIVFDLTDK